MKRSDSDRGTSPKRPRGDDDASYGQAPSGAGHYDPGGPSRGGGSEDGGRGGGRGRGGGTRGGRGRARQTYEERRRERLEQHDLVISRGVDKYGEKMKKMGGTGRPANLLANYFVLEKRTDWAIYHYRVDFLPEERETRIKKKLLRIHQDTLGAYIFDGSSLYLSHRLNPDPLILCSVREDQEKVELSVRLVAELAPTDVMYLQIYNIMVRKCLEFMELEELGRHFYDRHQAIKIEAHRLELWPGYKTSMRNHEHDVLLGVEITHKVLRTDNCLHVMTRLRGGQNYRHDIKEELVGSIVMTHYNRKTYRVDDIDWDNSPGATFDMKDHGTVTFADYFAKKYGLRCTDMRQPMLVSRPKKRDFHRGQTGPVLLVPEFCQMTGLTDEMRSNFQLMKSLTGYLHVSPDRRVDAVKKFMARLKQAPGVREELSRWGLKFNDNLVRVKGRVVDREKIMFGQNQHETASDKADWNAAFRNHEMASTVPLENWVVIVPQRDAQAIDEVVSKMQRVGEPIRFRVSRPREVIRIPDIRIPTYLAAIDQAMSNQKGKIQMIFIVLPRQVTDIYAAVKKRCAVDFGIPSQCFVAKNAHNPRGLMSIATKVVVQVNAKLGGEPWFVQIPLKKLMIVGFDVYHCGKRKGASVGAMVATTHETQAKYYSTVSFHNSKEELSSNLCADMTKCMYAFQNVNKDLPDRIIMYRDGVGEGQLNFVFETEMRQIKQAMNQVYTAAGKALPKFSFIVVTKKINTRIFAQLGNGRIENPDAGTIVDDVITLPERFDFYLISQFSRQGTVSPASYNVLCDSQGLDADKIQRLTYKLCHMYFNWSGTVTVPAPCQYAHKLAYLTGVALQGNSSSEGLSHLLHFL
ncbi:piwi-like protein Siwi isoform X2 [Folsomia candida]|uniref:piwi-like protein Siwi isoform X2 n=1 Tax=Folsomia candida TaxID=158441 RepID=UPI001604D886|nr:piwi-like protein Siwi isoform X2 [Folsomia candida]